MGLLPNTLLALALFLLAGHSAAQRNLGTINISFPEHPPQSALSNPVNDNFLGISWELSSFDTLCTFKYPILQCNPLVVQGLPPCGGWASCNRLVVVVPQVAHMLANLAGAIVISVSAAKVL